MSGWTWTGLTLALLGPGVIALLWKRSTRQAVSVARSAPWLALFALLVAAVAAIAADGEGLSAAEAGFGGMSWLSLPAAAALTLVFIFVFGPLAARALAWSGLGSFEAGQSTLAALPRWYLALTIVIVAGGEEWLYRGYAIERLEALTGDATLAGVLSLAAFGLVHLPLWGLGVALTTLVSGGMLTVLYLWQRDVTPLILAHVATDLCGLIVAPRQGGPHGPPPAGKARG